MSRLDSLRRRFSCQVLLERFSRGVLLSAALAVLVSALERWAGLEVNWFWTVAAFTAGTLLWCGTSFFQVPDRRSFAQLIDRLGSTYDRWTTALAFSGVRDSAHALAKRECAEYLGSREFRSLFPWRWPRSLPWVIVPCVVVAFLQSDIRSVRIAELERREEAREEVSKAVEQMNALAKQIEKDNRDRSIDELERIAEQLRRSAERLKSEPSDRSTAAKAALRELSKLEQLVQQMQEQPRELSQEEMEALAKALEQNEQTKQVAQALREGDASKAAEALEQTAQQMAAQDRKSAEETEKTLREALERLAQQRRNSEAVQQAMRQVLQRSGQGGASQLMRELAQMLRNSSNDAPSQNSKGGKDSQQNLQSILAAIQNMKSGRNQRQSAGSDQKGEKGNGQVFVESFADSGDPKGQSDGEQTPSGRPGSEYDRGTTDSPFGLERSETADKGGELSLQGQLGEGESLSQLLPATGGDDKARRRYKELYEAVLPAAEQAVLQENIPLGSRHFIRRYFESIRPPE